jgi:hypothetical protein
MKAAYIIVAALAAIMLALSARLKVTRDPNAVEIIGNVVGVPIRFFNLLALLEVAGGVGLLVGIGVKALGVAAGIGLVLYFVVATSSHVRVRDFVLEHIGPALLMLAVSVAALVLRLGA